METADQNENPNVQQSAIKKSQIDKSNLDNQQSLLPANQIQNNSRNPNNQRSLIPSNQNSNMKNPMKSELVDFLGIDLPDNINKNNLLVSKISADSMNLQSQHSMKSNTSRGGENNWMIKSFFPQAGSKYDPRVNLRMSVAFVGDSHVFNSTVKKIKESKNQEHIDKDFPPEFSSLWGFGESRNYNINLWKTYKWARPIEIFQGDYCVYQEPLSPHDI